MTQSHPTVTVRTDLRQRNVIEELSSAAVSADLVVVGTHKTGVIQGRSIGSRSLRIAGEAHLAVVVVPESSPATQTGNRRKASTLWSSQPAKQNAPDSRSP